MRLLAALFAILLAAPAAAAAAELPYVHAHRGGPQQLTRPAFAEETMPAFRDAWEVRRTVLELDVKLSSDRVPVAIHDDTLDRTTVCEGDVAAKTWEQLRAECPSDVLGIDPHDTAKADPPVPMARLREVLDYAKSTGAALNVEIKNIPGEADFDPSSAYAITVLDEVKASGLPLEQLIVQSFWPPNLDVAEEQLPGVQTAFLTAVGGGGAEFSAGRGYEWWSPSWPVTKAQVDDAHERGLKVVPWTVDTPDAVKAVKAAGADAVITNDPAMALAALEIAGAPAPSGGTPPTAGSPPPAARSRWRACRATRGAIRIRANRTVGSCVTARRIVRDYLLRGCPRAWKCTGRRRVTLAYKGGEVRFVRRRAR